MRRWAPTICFSLAGAGPYGRSRVYLASVRRVMERARTAVCPLVRHHDCERVRRLSPRHGSSPGGPGRADSERLASAPAIFPGASRLREGAVHRDPDFPGAARRNGARHGQAYWRLRPPTARSSAWATAFARISWRTSAVLRGSRGFSGWRDSPQSGPEAGCRRRVHRDVRRRRLAGRLHVRPVSSRVSVARRSPRFCESVCRTAGRRPRSGYDVNREYLDGTRTRR